MGLRLSGDFSNNPMCARWCGARAGAFPECAATRGSRRTSYGYSKPCGLRIRTCCVPVPALTVPAARAGPRMDRRTRGARTRRA